MQQRTEFREKDDLTCANCGCEAMIKHTGDASKGYGQQPYMCSCGTAMQFEHREARDRQTAGSATS